MLNAAPHTSCSATRGGSDHTICRPSCAHHFPPLCCARQPTSSAGLPQAAPPALPCTSHRPGAAARGLPVQRRCRRTSRHGQPHTRPGRRTRPWPRCAGPSQGRAAVVCPPGALRQTGAPPSAPAGAHSPRPGNHRLKASMQSGRGRQTTRVRLHILCPCHRSCSAG